MNLKTIYKAFIILVFVIACYSCQTTSNVRVTTLPTEGYDVYYNSTYVGKTPVYFTASNHMSQMHEVEFKLGDKSIKKNYLNLEWKPVNIFLFGMTFYISLLWAKGPAEDQTFYLEKENDLEKKVERLSYNVNYNPKVEDDINLLLNTLIKNYKGKSNRTIFIVLKKYKGIENDEEIQKVHRLLYNIATNQVFESKLFRLIEREHLETLLKEKSLSLQGLVDADESMKIGSLKEANLMMVIDFQNNIFSAKIVDLHSGEILSFVTGNFNK
jgi:hypothetical protein